MHHNVRCDDVPVPGHRRARRPLQRPRPDRRLGRDALLRWFEDARVAVGGTRSTPTSPPGARRCGCVARVRVDVLAPLRVTGRPYEVGIGVSAHRRLVVQLPPTACSPATSAWPPASRRASTWATKGSAPLPDDLRSSWSRHRIDAAEPVRAAAERRPAGARGLPVPAGRPHPLRRPRHQPARQQRRARHLVPRRARRAAPRRARLPDRRPARRARAQLAARDYLAEVHYPGSTSCGSAVVELDDDVVRYACGLFDGPTCVGLAEATGGLSPRRGPASWASASAAFMLRASRSVSGHARRRHLGERRASRRLRRHARAQAQQHAWWGSPRGAASSAVARTQWSVAIPTTSTASTPRAAQPAAQVHPARLGALEPRVRRGVGALVEHRLDRRDVEVRVERRARGAARGSAPARCRRSPGASRKWRPGRRGGRGWRRRGPR